MARYLDPKNDVVFKKIFGQNPHLLMSFLNSQLRFEDGSYIKSIEYLPSELLPESPLKKRTIVDVRCKDSLGRQFIVEMQMEWVKAFFERMLFNTARLYGNQLPKGKEYLVLQPVYGLAILNENFDKETSEYYHQFVMVNPKNTDEKIAGISIVFIELNKLVPQTNEEKRLTVLWLRFLKEINESTGEVAVELQSNSIIKEAVQLCEEAAYTDAERVQYDAYWDEVRREHLLIDGKFAEGKEEGRAEGKAEGRAEKVTEFVLNLHADCVDVEQIAKYTGLSVEAVEEILNQNNLE
jgi:predicted transposase/invertase (TIGR01784 family)